VRSAGRHGRGSRAAGRRLPAWGPPRPTAPCGRRLPPRPYPRPRTPSPTAPAPPAHSSGPPQRGDPVELPVAARLHLIGEPLRLGSRGEPGHLEAVAIVVLPPHHPRRRHP